MEIDRGTIKALSADTRLKILKFLSGQRATGADISRLLGLSPSTVNEHLKKLEASGLVLRKETGHKWVYYEASWKGKALLTPGLSMQFVVVLAFGILMFVGGAFLSLAQKARPWATPMTAEATTAGARTAIANAGQVAAQPSLLPVVVMLVGAAMIIVAVLKKK